MLYMKLPKRQNRSYRGKLCYDVCNFSLGKKNMKENVLDNNEYSLSQKRGANKKLLIKISIHFNYLNSYKM